MNGKGFYHEIGPRGSKESDKEEFLDARDKRSLKFSHKEDEIGEALYNKSKEVGRKLAEEMVTKEEARLGRLMTEEEKLAFKKAHTREMLKEGLSKVFKPDTDKEGN